MKTQTYEAIFDAPKSVLWMMTSNPALVSGLLGHISILQTYDTNRGTFVTPERLTSPPSKFRVAYIFGTPDSKVTVQLGEMEVKAQFDSITYSGFTYDNKLRWEITFSFKEVQHGKTKVTVLVMTEEERGIFERFLGGNQFSLADHVIQSHIIPFIKFYMGQLSQFKLEIGLDSLEYRTISEEEGIIGEVIAKMIRLSKENNMEYGIIIVQGENVKGRVVIRDGKPVDAWFRCNGSIKAGRDAILDAMTSTEKGKVSLYEIDLKSLVENAIEQIFTNVIMKS